MCVCVCGGGGGGGQKVLTACVHLNDPKKKGQWLFCLHCERFTGQGQLYKVRQ